MALFIRAMQLEDMDKVYAIELTAHRAPWTLQILTDCVLVGYDCQVLVLQESNEPIVIGFMISRYYQRTYHILNLCIEPSYQDKGYGQYLLKSILNKLLPTIVDLVMLEVRPSNVAALHIYEKMGFQKIGIKADYYSDQQGQVEEDAVVLQKLLT